MSDYYAHVYLSPHLDDVVLSCGGLIRQQVKAGQRPLVITLFAGQPPGDVELSAFAQSLHARWGHPEGLIAARWAEDQAALAVLGADYLRLNYADCIYRGRRQAGRTGSSQDPGWYYASEQALFGPVHPAEHGLPDELAATLNELVPIGDGLTLYAPLTVGNHVDHQLTYVAALILRTRGWRVCFYEDYPYASNQDALSAVLTARGIEQGQSSLIPLSEDDLAAKVQAIACYQSQLQVLFGGVEAMAALARDHISAVGGERLWWLDPVHTQ
jgi:LmbE family N-acetylglucosaminyl deacetylase